MRLQPQWKLGQRWPKNYDTEAYAVDPGIEEDGFAVIAAELCGLASLYLVWCRGRTDVLLVQSLAPSTVNQINCLVSHGICSCSPEHPEQVDGH